MTARLVGRTGKARGVDQPVSGMVTMGSGSGNEVRIESRTVSRRHAQIVQQGTAYYILDLGSSNGTLLNGEAVKRFPLRHLDVISLGPDVDLIFLESAGALERRERPAATRATVVWLDGPCAGQVLEIPPERALQLGREGQMAAMAAISRRHAALTLRGDRVTVENFGANGTWVNGSRIDVVTSLRDGDTVNLGGLVSLRLSFVGSALPEARSEDTAEPPGTIALEPVSSLRQRPLDAPMVTPRLAAPVVPIASPATLAPTESAVGLPADAAAQGDRTIFAPREPAMPPKLGPPSSPVAPGVAFRPPREPAQGIPEAISNRARAARQSPDKTILASGSEVPAPPREPLPSHPPASGRIIGVCLDGPTRVSLNTGAFQVGRQLGCDVVVESPDVGRLHARLQVQDAQVLVEDLRTANGTFVDDQRVTGVAEVPDGSRVRFATVEFAVSYVRNRRQNE